ncbi:MAG: potassium channel family protein [Rhizobiaceae bacterium]
MLFTYAFLEVLLTDLIHIGPPLIVITCVIVALGYVIGRYEGWSIWDSIYHAFVAATTVGYGDLRPTTKLTKFLAVLLAFIGIIYAGLIVAISVHAAQVAFIQIEGPTDVPIL